MSKYIHYAVVPTAGRILHQSNKFDSYNYKKTSTLLHWF